MSGGGGTVLCYSQARREALIGNPYFLCFVWQWRGCPIWMAPSPREAVLPGGGVWGGRGDVRIQLGVGGGGVGQGAGGGVGGDFVHTI